MRKLVFYSCCVLCCLLLKSAYAERLVAHPVHNTGYSVTLGDITDSRTNGKFFKYLRVSIKLKGSELAKALGTVGPVVTAAVDDTSQSLLKKDEKPDPLLWTLRKIKSNRTEIENNVDLVNPPRRATSFSLMGYMGVLTPDKDPSTVLRIKHILATKNATKLSPVYKKNGIEITVVTKTLAENMKKKQQEEEKKQRSAGNNPGQLMGDALGQAFKSMFSGFFSMGDNDLLYIISDPGNKIGYLELVDSSGKPVKTSGMRTFSHENEKGTYHYSVGYSQALPKSVQLKVYLVSKKTYTRVPFKFESQPLP